MKFITTKELAAELKAIGVNATMASIKRESSDRYLTITIRKLGVDIAAVKALAARHNTWQMDITDYVTGQSVDVKLSDEVRAGMAGPWVETVRTATIPADGQGLEITPGVLLWNIDGECWVRPVNGDLRRSNYIRTTDMTNKWAIEAMAFAVAQIKAGLLS